MKICVLGLGYIGLPTAILFATHGHEVVGVDVNKRIIETINNNKMPLRKMDLKFYLRKQSIKSASLRERKSKKQMYS